MRKIINILSLAALVLGIIFGFFFGPYTEKAEFLGAWYVSVLKAFICPVIFTSIAVTVYRTSKNKDRLVLKSVGLFSLMFIVSFLLSSVIVTAVDPAKGFSFGGEEWTGQPLSFEFGFILRNLFPSSLEEVFVNVADQIAVFAETPRQARDAGGDSRKPRNPV